MSKTMKLFVGGLPPTLTKSELAEVFKEFSPHVKIDLKMEKDKKLNKGYAFLMVKDEDTVDTILKREFSIRSRKVQVQLSKKILKHKSTDLPSRLFCRGIPRESTDTQLTEYFSEFVACRAAYAITEGNNNRKDFGFVELFCQEDAQLLLQIKTFEFMKCHMIVEEYNKTTRTITKGSRNESIGHDEAMKTLARESTPQQQTSKKYLEKYSWAKQNPHYNTMVGITGYGPSLPSFPSMGFQGISGQAHQMGADHYSGPYYNRHMYGPFDYDLGSNNSAYDLLSSQSMEENSSDRWIQLSFTATPPHERQCSEDLYDMAQNFIHASENVRFNILKRSKKTPLRLGSCHQ